jgi:flagellum-specific peptidoglycan hydrolase FlgJ
MESDAKNRLAELEAMGELDADQEAEYARLKALLEEEQNSGGGEEPAPASEEPAAEEPKVEEPKTEEPVAEEPAAEEPKEEEPKEEEPATEELQAEEVKTQETVPVVTELPEEKREKEEEEDEEEIPEDTPVIVDTSQEAVYQERPFNPSEKFIEKGEKLLYNEDMPLDNIPAFITTEMILGALKVQDEYGYPASVTIAQIIQESGFGVYGPNGENGQGLSYLAYQYNNLFGIKGAGTAGTVSMRTGEQAVSGEFYTITANFRVYNTYTECIEDRTQLLERRYSSLIEDVTDANTFAMRIARKWATSLTYGEHLIQQMERYDLYRLDKMTLEGFDELLEGQKEEETFDTVPYEMADLREDTDTLSQEIKQAGITIQPVEREHLLQLSEMAEFSTGKQHYFKTELQTMASGSVPDFLAGIGKEWTGISLAEK